MTPQANLTIYYTAGLLYLETEKGNGKKLSACGIVPNSPEWAAWMAFFAAERIETPISFGMALTRERDCKVATAPCQWPDWLRPFFAKAREDWRPPPPPLREWSDDHNRATPEQRARGVKYWEDMKAVMDRKDPVELAAQRVAAEERLQKARLDKSPISISEELRKKILRDLEDIGEPNA